MQPLIPFWTSPDPSTPPTCRCFTFKPRISFPTITVPYKRVGTEIKRSIYSKTDKDYFNAAQIKHLHIFTEQNRLFFSPHQNSHGRKGSKTLLSGSNNNRQSLFAHGGNVDSLHHPWKGNQWASIITVSASVKRKNNKNQRAASGWWYLHTRQAISKKMTATMETHVT